MKSEHFDVYFVVTDKEVGCVCKRNLKVNSKTNNLAPPLKKEMKKVLLKHAVLHRLQMCQFLPIEWHKFLAH